MISYHSKRGNFCSKASAHSVSKDGERFKVVRQYRRIRKDNKVELELIEPTEPVRPSSDHEIVYAGPEKRTTMESLALSRSKVAMVRSLLGRGTVPIQEMAKG
jgi:hypothetical protein